MHVIDDQIYSAEFHEKNTFVRSISERYRNFRKLNRIRSFILIDRTDVSYIEQFDYRLSSIIDYSNDFSREMHLKSLKIIFRLSQILVRQIE